MRRPFQPSRLEQWSRLAAIISAVLALNSFPKAILADEAARQPQLDFFENRIRPVLIEHCYECHSEAAAEANELQAGLFVDHREGLLAGGDSGPAVVPQNPEASLLLAAMRYESYEMPPKGKLSDAVLADFETWIKMGAVDPREKALSTSNEPAKRDPAIGQSHWAYQPIRLPAIENIDALLARQLPKTDILPAPQVDRRTLVRRLSFDLHGLPPTPAEIETFVSDPRPDAIERLVDRLLAGPEFGEHWGRHWLDIVRFAESVTLRGLVQHQAYRYRDYVISSLNDDLAYDQFLLEQVAGDLIAEDRSVDNAAALEQARRQYIATTFLTLGNNNLEDQDKEKLRMDVVDEQLNVIGSAILAQTIGCARCHDHKFDPIPTSDYYALAGIFRSTQTTIDANVSQWIERPLPMPKYKTKAIEHHQAVLTELTDKIELAKKQLGPADTNTKSIPLDQLAGTILDDDQAVFKGDWQTSSHSPRFAGQHYRHDRAEGAGEKTATFKTTLADSGVYEVRVSYTPGDNRSSSVRISVQDYLDAHNVTIDQRKRPPIDGLFVSLGNYQFNAESPAVVTISNFGADGHVIVDSVQWLPVEASGGPIASMRGVANVTDPVLQENLNRWQAELKQLRTSTPESDSYMAVAEEPEIRDLSIHIRGNVHQYGRVVPRGFLSAAGDHPFEIPTGQSGRVELGKWLGHPDNPLPARVLANRVWLWLFGEGLVRSPDNFGTTGLSPTHPEVLDYLAAKLIQSNWSLKSLVREIVLSETYQRDSEASAELRAFDPDNLLWMRQNRRRIESEALVDAMLLAGGHLERRMYGKTFPDQLTADYGHDAASNRRSVYWPVLRNAIPDIIAVFDGADPSLVTGRRNQSTVATQALLMMNNPWVNHQSVLAGTRIAKTRFETNPARIDFAFASILGRKPTVEEITLVSEYLAKTSPNGWPEVIQSIWSTIEFRYRR